jgi:hypothetical protein
MNSQQSNFQPRETHLTMLKFIKTGNSGNGDSLKGPREFRDIRGDISKPKG